MMGLTLRRKGLISWFTKIDSIIVVEHFEHTRLSWIIYYPRVSTSTIRINGLHFPFTILLLIST